MCLIAKAAARCADAAAAAFAIAFRSSATAASCAVSMASQCQDRFSKRLGEGDYKTCRNEPRSSYNEDTLGNAHCLEIREATFLGDVPSLEEAESAIRELGATITKKYGSVRALHLVLFQRWNYIGFLRVNMGGKFEGIDAVAIEADSISMVPKESSFDAQTLHSGLNPHSCSLSNIVARCVDLLQRVPKIQTAVVALARDPALWEAFTKNDKVQKLLSNGHLRIVLDAHQQVGNPMVQDGANYQPVAFHFIMNLVWDVMLCLVDILNHVFGFMDGLIFGEQKNAGRQGNMDREVLDKIDSECLKVCLVLTILVLALVVLKRNSTS